LVSILEAENKELKEKLTASQTSWLKKLPFGKEKQSSQSKTNLNYATDPNKSDNNNNTLPIIPIFGIVSVVALLSLVVFHKTRRNKKTSCG